MIKRFVPAIALVILLCSLTGCFITKFPGMSGYVTLPQAAGRGDIVKVKELLDKGADPNKNYLGGIALHEAVDNGHIEIVRLLIDRGANLELISPSGRTALQEAAKSDYIEIVRLLIDRGAKLDLISDSDSSPLMLAMNNRNASIANLLIEKGADVHVRDRDGCSVLIYAVRNDNVKQVRLLLDRGVDLDVTCKINITNAADKSVDFRGTALAMAQIKGSTSIAKLLDRAERERYSKDVSPVQARETDSTYFSQVKSDVDELPPVKGKSNNKAYAIVIGIEQYRQKLPKVDYATSDAQKVTEYLTRTLGYPEENVVTLLNEHATKSDFEKYFEKWLVNNVEKGSTVFVYYSGHGAPDPKSGSAYLVPYDGDPAFIDQTGYPLNKMYDVLGKLPAKEVIVALDSCFSGAGGRSVIAKGSRPLVINMKNAVSLAQNMTVMSASASNQTSSTYDSKGHGLFTYFMLKGIKYEDVMRPDGSIKIDDLYGYIKPQVERIARKQYNNEQTPQLIEPNK